MSALHEARDAAAQRLRLELLATERDEAIRLRDEGQISDEVLHRIERELDLEEARLETEE